jgi:hypothetical protein
MTHDSRGNVHRGYVHPVPTTGVAKPRPEERREPPSSMRTGMMPDDQRHQKAADDKR